MHSELPVSGDCGHDWSYQPADTPGAEGLEYVPELKKFYTSNAGDNTTVWLT
jgi:hypothetical protein